MNPEAPDPLSILLDRYFDADEYAVARLEQKLLACIEPYIRSQFYAEHLSHEDLQDLSQTARVCTISGLRSCRMRQKRIHYFPGWARKVALNVVREAERRHTARRAMTLAVLDIISKSRPDQNLARWHSPPVWMIGLLSRLNSPFEPTEPYIAFCYDDTAFAQRALNGRNPANPAQVKLSELLCKFLEWIETPIEQSSLIDHLLQLQPLATLTTISLEALAEDCHSPVLDRVSVDTYAKKPECDWEEGWEAIRTLSASACATLLLNQERATLLLLTAQADPRVALTSLFQISLEEMGQLWKQLPLSDAQIATHLKTSVENVHKMRSVARAKLRQKI